MSEDDFGRILEHGVTAAKQLSVIDQQYAQCNQYLDYTSKCVAELLGITESVENQYEAVRTEIEVSRIDDDIYRLQQRLRNMNVTPQFNPPA